MEAARLFVHGAADEEGGIAITQTQPAQAWIEPSEKAGRAVRAVEAHGKVAADRLPVARECHASMREASGVSAPAGVADAVIAG